MRAVLGGGYEKTADPNVNAIWLKADEAVFDSVSTHLTQNGYNIRQHFEESTSSDDSMAIAVKASNAAGCTKVIQVTHFLKDSEPALNLPGRFGFTVVIIWFDKQHVSGGTHYVTRGGYEKDYEYQRTMEVLSTLSMSDVGEQIAKDLDSATELADIKTSKPLTNP